MSAFVRRAQFNVAKLEMQLENARKEVIRQREYDIIRAQKMAERITMRNVVKKAARSENLQQIRIETSCVLMSLCVKSNLSYTLNIHEAFMEWKKVTEFAPKTNLYQKAYRFIQETLLQEEKSEKSIPIYAKTLTGDIISLMYNPHYDKRDLQLQLQTIDPTHFPISSTNIVRLSEDPTAPVNAEEIVGLFQHGAKLVYYSPYSKDHVGRGYYSEYGPSICYAFYIKKEGINRSKEYGILFDIPINLYYYPETKMIETKQVIAKPFPLDKLREMIAMYIPVIHNVLPYNRNNTTLTEEAQEELIAIFNTVRRDN